MAGAARRLLDVRNRRLERVIFVATTGRSGTLTLVRLFQVVPGTVALHEPYPAMHDDVLHAAARGDTAFVARAYWSRKAVNIRRAAAGHRYYLEANHLFIKVFLEQAVDDFGDRLRVIHLVREPVAVANSIYRLGDWPGTEEGNRWWLDHHAPTNRIRLAEPLEEDPEFSHPFYRGLWYWCEVETRIAEARRRYPHLPFVPFQTRWFNDLHRVAGLMEALGLEVDRETLASRVGRREHGREHQKRRPGLPEEEGLARLERFAALLEERGYPQAAHRLRQGQHLAGT
ncbi:MAG: hypothetical protein D6739_07350 [Nitrospirae bacterium]|nr:MAG: hypothetical protein D6739_07350 [Nitrospirota bacterium]